MIGNDIVDIAEAKTKSNWQRPRFLEKLFTEAEQVLIKQSEDSFLMVWQLWSMKEAAYKLFTQANPSRFYNPKGFQCTVKGNSRIVRFQDFKCYVKTKITANYIVSEARLTKNKITSKVLIFNTKNEKLQSKFLKTKLINLVSTSLGISKHSLKFMHSEFGIPTVNYNSTSINVSLTHHGNFGAYAFINSVASSGVERSLRN